MLRNWSLNPLAKVAIGILRSYGTNAHVYLPGVGTLNGLTAGNYLDSAGTTAATVDNPVGLSLDALQAMTLGSELVTNGAFTTDTSGWTNSAGTIASTGGALTITNGGAVNGLASQTITTVSGKWYLATADFTKGTAVNGAIQASAIAAGEYELGYHLRTSSGAMQFIFKAASATTYFCAINESSSNATNVFDNISVREIPGIHATQGTTANKPILRRGLLNQLTYSQDASNAAWAKISASATASKIIEAAGSSQHYISQSIDMPDGGVTFAAAFAPAERSWVTMYLGTPNTSAWFNVSTGVIGTMLASVTASIASLPNGYKLCVINGSQSSVAAITRGLYIADSDGNNTYTGDGTSGILFGGAGLFQGTYTAQQIIDAGGIPLTTSAAASNPNAGKYWWQLDGTDSLMSAPLFQMSDDHCVIAGLNPTTSATDMAALNFGSGAGAQMVGCLLVTNNGFAKAAWWDDTTLASVSDATNHFGATFVASARKIGNSKTLTVNGVQVGAADTTVMGATTIVTGIIGGYSAAAGGKFTGSIYPVIAIKGTLSDSDLLVLERFVGQLSGVSGI